MRIPRIATRMGTFIPRICVVAQAAPAGTVIVVIVIVIIVIVVAWGPAAAIVIIVVAAATTGAVVVGPITSPGRRATIRYGADRPQQQALDIPRQTFLGGLGGNRSG